jgi:SAM-dependent methyltransferase
MEQIERLEREREFHNLRFADDSERERRTGRFYAAIGYGFERYRQRVAEACEGKRLLEYGCGTDGLSYDMAARAAAVVGIDISDVAIAEAQRMARQRALANLQFQVDDAEAMSFAPHSFDAIAGTGIIHHLDIERSSRELRRVLRPGGVAIFAEPLGHNPLLNWYRNRTPELRTVDEHPLLNADLRAMAGHFKSIKVTYFGLIAPILGFVSRHARPRSLVTRSVWWLDRQLCRIPYLRRFAWYCIVELYA